MFEVLEVLRYSGVHGGVGVFEVVEVLKVFRFSGFQCSHTPLLREVGGLKTIVKSVLCDIPNCNLQAESRQPKLWAHGLSMLSKG